MSLACGRTCYEVNAKGFHVLFSYTMCFFLILCAFLSYYVLFYYTMCFFIILCAFLLYYVLFYYIYIAEVGKDSQLLLVQKKLLPNVEFQIILLDSAFFYRSWPKTSVCLIDCYST